MSGTSSVLGFSVGVIELVLAVLVLRRLSRFGRAFPWLAGVLAFFLLRGATRVALDPEPNSAEERGLRPRPQLKREESSGRSSRSPGTPRGARVQS